MLSIHYKDGYKEIRRGEKQDVAIKNLYLGTLIEREKNKVWFYFVDAQFVESDGKTFRRLREMEGAYPYLTSDSYLTSYGTMITHHGGRVAVYEDNFKTYRQLSYSIRDEGNKVALYYEDPYANTWLLYLTDTLRYYDKNKKNFVNIPIQDNQKLGAIHIAGAHCFKQGELWIASLLGVQIVRLSDGKVLKTFTTRDGLTTTNLYSLIGDEAGGVWVSTQDGISRIDSKTYKIDNYFVGRDLPIASIYSMPINRGIQHRGKYSGNLYYKGSSGLLMFNPKDIKEQPNTAKIVFTDIKIMNESVQMDSTITVAKIIELAPDADMLTIEFTLLNFSNPQFNSYEYQLMGFDKRRINGYNNNTATYTNLEPGTYRFRVWAKNDRGVPTKDFSELIIIKNPYLWQTWWFRLLAAFVILGGAAGLVYWRLSNLNKQKLILEQKVEERTAEIVRQKDEISTIASNLAVSMEETNALNEELNITLDQLKEQTTLIEKKNIEIVAGINYAKRIQTAMLPQQEQYSEFVPPFWVFYRPRDIVSGDFYWISEVRFSHKKKRILIAAVDCTGHGVPGALMSMIGHNLLDEVTATLEVHSPCQILTVLNKLVRKTLRQQDTDNRDGMEISLLAIDVQKNEASLSCSQIIFAGANRPLCYVDALGVLQTVKGDKMPIGGHERQMLQEFTEFVLPHEGIKRLYLFSDGYQDQFGGYHKKRFSKRRLAELLEKTTLLELEDQKKAIEETFEDWLNTGREYQIDDALVLGIEVVAYT